MKLIKTRLWSRMGEDTLDSTMHICIEGPDIKTIEAVVDHYKRVKNRKIAL